MTADAQRPGGSPLGRARDEILAGPRGIGKTAVLWRSEICRNTDYEVVNQQSAGGNAGMIDSVLGEARERIESGAGAWQLDQARAFERIGAGECQRRWIRRRPEHLRPRRPCCCPRLFGLGDGGDRVS